jgi:histidinol-phosphate phosphatase family protein
MGGAVFLDRDGVLNENRHTYVRSWREFRWLPRVLEALAILAARAAPVIVVTNQSMVGRGLVGAAVLDGIHARMQREAQQHGGRIDRVYACLHAPSEACPCRKPLPGLL